MSSHAGLADHDAIAAFPTSTRRPSERHECPRSLALAGRRRGPNGQAEAGRRLSDLSSPRPFVGLANVVSQRGSELDNWMPLAVVQWENASGKPSGSSRRFSEGSTETPLPYAAAHGHEVVVQQLLEKVANIEAKSEGRPTPLLLATVNGNEAVVKLL
ncbi:hypothetical protein F5B21DRAFT_509754 [Xylaria acuta]|nr:hypothetical protein F5B21DRAFT_509754 [Xylaria acuta]